MYDVALDLAVDIAAAPSYPCGHVRHALNTSGTRCRVCKDHKPLPVCVGCGLFRETMRSQRCAECKPARAAKMHRATQMRYKASPVVVERDTTPYALSAEDLKYTLAQFEGALGRYTVRELGTDYVGKFGKTRRGPEQGFTVTAGGELQAVLRRKSDAAAGDAVAGLEHEVAEAVKFWSDYPDWFTRKLTTKNAFGLAHDQDRDYYAEKLSSGLLS